MWKPSLFKSNWWGYFLGNFWKNLGIFLFQHLVTLQYYYTINDQTYANAAHVLGLQIPDHSHWEFSTGAMGSSQFSSFRSHFRNGFWRCKTGCCFVEENECYLCIQNRVDYILLSMFTQVWTSSQLIIQRFYNNKLRFYNHRQFSNHCDYRVVIYDRTALQKLAFKTPHRPPLKNINCKI